MRMSRLAEDQRVEMLREAEKTSVAGVAKRNEVSERTIYCWRQHFAVASAHTIHLIKNTKTP